MASPIVPRGLPECLLVLVILALVLLQRLDAFVTLVVEPSRRDHLPHRLDAVLYAEIRNDAKCPKPQVLCKLLDNALASACKGLSFGIMGEIVFAVLVTSIRDNLCKFLDIRA